MGVIEWLWWGKREKGGMVVVAERERTVGELQFLGNKSPTGMVGIWTW